uniref:Uncharacterized protein n=1 Tax=Trichuris muris TaxID=70415 RepID=A0A5S6QMX4_TRIMR
MPIILKNFSFIYEDRKTNVLIAEFEDAFHIAVAQLGKFSVVVKVTSSRDLPELDAHGRAVYDAKVLLGPDEVAFRVMARQMASVHCVRAKPVIVFFGLINPTPEYARCLLGNLMHHLSKE